MRRSAPLLSLSLVLFAGVLAAGCGASALTDTETATEAKAAGATATTVVPPESVVASADATLETTDTASAADDADAWSIVDSSTQTFAASLDQATQSIASCQTDAAAGQDFATCAGRAYTAVAAAGATLLSSIAAAADLTDGPCHDALAAMGGAMQTMVTDYQRAVTITDLTSADTLQARLGDDAQGYANSALTAASACSN